MRTFTLLALLVLSGLSAAETAVMPDSSLAKARRDYPLQRCIVSGEHLEAGQIVEYVYQEEGKPNRLVRFCCHKCERRFKADPAKYLEKLDAAAARTTKKN